MQIHFSKQMSRETLPADLTNIEFNKQALYILAV